MGLRLRRSGGHRRPQRQVGRPLITFRDLLVTEDVLTWPLRDPGGLASAQATLTRQPLDSLRQRLARHPGNHAVDLLVQQMWGDRTSIRQLLADVADNRLDSDGAVARLRVDHTRPGLEILRWRATSLLIPPAVLLGFLCDNPPRRVKLLDPSLRPAGKVASLHVHPGAAFGFEDAWQKLVNAYPALHLDTGWKGPEKQLLYAALRLRAAVVAHGTHGGEFQSCPLCCPRPAIDALETGIPEAVVPGQAPAVARDRPRRTAKDAPVDESFVIALLRRLVPELALVQYLRVLVRTYGYCVMDPTASRLENFKPALDEAKKFWSKPERLINREREDLDLKVVETRPLVPKSLGTIAEYTRDTTGLTQMGLDAAMILALNRAPPVREGVPPLAAAVRTYRADIDRALAYIELRPEALQTIRALDLCSQERDSPLWLAAPFIHYARRRVREIIRRPENRSLNLRPLHLTLHAGEDYPHLLTGLRAVSEPFDLELFERGDRLGHGLALTLDPDEWTRENRYVPVRKFDRLLDLEWARTVYTREPSGRCPTWVIDDIGRLEDELGLKEANLVAESRWRETQNRGGGTTQLEHKQTVDARALLKLLHDPERMYGLLVAGPTTPLERVIDDHIRIGPTASFRATEPVETQRDLEVLTVCRAYLAARVALWQTTLEINPSSNLVVGGLRSPLAQTFARTRPSDDNPHALPLAISTDDPIVFATSLGDEYAYAWAGLVLDGGEPPGRARAWLEDAALASWAARFAVQTHRT